MDRIDQREAVELGRLADAATGTRRRWRVAIDARTLSHPQRSGFKTYVECLVAALPPESRHQYTLYVDRRIHAGQLSERFDLVTVPYPAPVLQLPLREQLTMPARIYRDRPDIVHFPCNTAPLWCSRPYVVTVHDVLQFELRFRARLLRQRVVTAYSRMTVRRAVSHAASIITVSRSSRARLIERFGLEPDRVVAVYPGIRPAFTRGGSADLLPRQLEPGFLLAIGSADDRKNIPALLRAYSALPSKNRRDTPLVIVCPHHSVPRELQPTAASLGIEPLYLCDVDDETLAALYRAALAFVWPSLAEGFGLPPLESMACGTPVVAVESDAGKEVMGDSALFVEPYAAPALVKALQLILEDRTLRKTLAERGAIRAESFRWEDCAAKTVEVYERVLAAESR